MDYLLPVKIPIVKPDITASNEKENKSEAGNTTDNSDSESRNEGIYKCSTSCLIKFANIVNNWFIDRVQHQFLENKTAPIIIEKDKILIIFESHLFD